MKDKPLSPKIKQVEGYDIDDDIVNAISQL